MPMKMIQLVVAWRHGLHLRPASRLVARAREFQSAVRLRVGERVADARSIFQILLLSASLGTTMIIEADGTDEQEALNAVSAVFATDEEDLSGS